MRKSKKKTIIFIVVLLLLLWAVGAIVLHFYQKHAVGPVGKNIMLEIDRCADADGDCTIDLQELTNFEWDTVAAFHQDASVRGEYESEEIIRLLGDDYEPSPGCRSRLIFLNDGVITYEESYPASIESSSEFNICILQSSDHPWWEETHSYCILSVEDAIVDASCFAYKSGYGYQLTFQVKE